METQESFSALLDAWARTLYASYLDYAYKNARSWKDKCDFQTKSLIESFLAREHNLLKAISTLLMQRSNITPLFQYSEDFTYLNYLHLPVILARVIGRNKITLEKLEAELKILDDMGEDEAYDLGEAFIKLLQEENEAFQKLCDHHEKLSPR